MLRKNKRHREWQTVLESFQELTEKMDGLMYERNKEMRSWVSPDQDALKDADPSVEKRDIIVLNKMLAVLNTYLKQHPHQVIKNNFRHEQIKEIATVIYDYLGVHNVSITSILGVDNLWPTSKNKEKGKNYFPIDDGVTVDLIHAKATIEKVMRDLTTIIHRSNIEAKDHTLTVNGKSAPFFLSTVHQIKNALFSDRFGKVLNSAERQAVVQNVSERYALGLAARIEENKAHNQPALLLTLPPEILLTILFYLSATAKLVMEGVSQGLTDIARDDVLWKREMENAGFSVVQHKEGESFKSTFFKAKRHAICNGVKEKVETPSFSLM